MKVYYIENYTKKTTSVDYESEYIDIDLDTDPVKWVKPNLYISEVRPKTSDFLYLGSCLLTFVNKVKTDIYDCLNEFGDFLPINIDKLGDAYIFNLKTINENVVNKEKTYFFDHEEFLGKNESSSRVDNGTILLAKLVLHKAMIKSPIFLIKQRGYTVGPFCTSGFFPEENEFYSIYMKHGFNGLEFLEIMLD